LTAVRRRVALQTAAGPYGDAAARAADSTAFLGLDETELTPQVQAALAQLFTEIDELRKEVARLKAHLTEAETLADEDVLTPVANRRAFMRELTRTTAFAQRYGGPAALVYFDLDGFKQVNDRFGHAAGDDALKTVAQRLLTHVRESDLVGRIGGDEFGVILNQVDEAAATAKAAQLASAIEAEPIACGDYMTPLHVTWGVRAIDGSVPAEGLLSEADARMYAAKKAKAAR
jgi:diguanylate cyclase (GGDEF)-like protein